MGAVAPVGEKQALEAELTDVRGLIADGEYEAAVGWLEEASDQARSVAAVESLVEIRRLAHAVWLKAPRGSDTTDRADRLVLSINRDEVVPSDVRGMAVAVSVLLVLLLVAFAIVVVVAIFTFSLGSG